MSCGGFFMLGWMHGCFGDHINNQSKATVRSNHTTSVRGNLVKTYKTDIHDDYFLDIDQELGKGGCGVVVIGEHKETRTQYAIKIVDKSHAERGRLDRELKLLKDVDHTNVVRLFTVYDVPSHMYFVMELCLGGHLGNLLARQPRKYLDETWAKQLALQLLSAVAHIHTRGIAHRDIKLQNILIDQNTNDRTAQLKLIDFGYGSRYIGALPMRTKCGTPYTTAPEVIREHYDERCDVWSCGVVLYIMLCGRRPFEALNCAGTLADAGKAAMITNILAGRYHFNHKPWQTVTKQGLNFVKSLLHPDYKQRMRSYEALENPWLIDSNILNEHASILSSQKSFKAANQIRRMSEVTELQRTGMVALVFGINIQTTTDMSTVFQSFDTDSSGMLSKEEFSSAMSKIVPELTQLDLEKLFNIIDYDKNNSISYTEFLAATLDPRDLDIGELNKAFKLFDEDGNGYISKDEMRKVIRMQCEQAISNTHHSPSMHNPTLDIETLTTEVNAKVERIFAEADVNNDGAISHAEFLWVMTGLDFHKLDQLGLPIHGGVSAKDTFMHNLQRRSCDSAEDWNEDIDQPFDVHSTYSFRSSNITSGNTAAGIQYPPLSPQGSSWNNNNQHQYQASAMAGYGNRDTGNSQKLKKQSSPQRTVSSNSSIVGMPLISTSSYKQLETYEEKNVESNSSSSHIPRVERAGGGGGIENNGEDEGNERPVQRHSRRLRDGPVVERQDTPTMFRGILGKSATILYGGDEVAYTVDEAAVNGTGSGVGTPVKAGSVNKNLAFYQEPDLPMLTGRKSSEEDVEMAEITQYGTKVIVNSIPGTPIQTPARGLSKTFSQKQLSVKFDSVSLYNTLEYEEERSGRFTSMRSGKEQQVPPGMLSRGTSYRESTILDGTSGKDTIKVMVEKPYGNSDGGNKDQLEEEVHMLTARQNSGNTALPASAVEPPPPIESPAPFLSTRGFSLSNMLRTNDTSTQQGGANNEKETPARITNNNNGTTTTTGTGGAGLTEAIAPSTGSSKNIIMPLIRTTSFSRKTSGKR